jgi:cytochrome c oxidase assembly factor CtaG
MVQHELLMRIGVPLLIVGRPLVPWLWALPDGIRAHAGSGLPQRSVSELWRWLTTPAIAWALHGVTIWVWHLPALYEAAVRSEAVHALQHAMFVGTAVIFWWGVMYGRYGRLAYGAAALFLFTTMVHTGVLGAMFALSTAPFYGVYRDRAAALGIDAAADQQLAGLYMWIPAGVVLTVCGLAMVVAWLAEAERRARARARTTMLALIVVAAACVGGCSSMPHEQEVRALTGGDPFRGRELIRQYGCDSCHTIPGVHGADANVGPPLVNVARRLYLAGHIQNTPENMMRWIQHPRALDPKTAMPEMGVTGSDSRDITAYLYTLR